MFLSSMLRLAGHGTSAGRRAQSGGVEHDSRPGGSDPAALNQAAWESLRGIVGLLPAAAGTEAAHVEPREEGTEF
jgi:hypothetical protein